MKLSNKLKSLRKQNGLSQLELSEKLNVSRQAVSGWESGTSKPSTDNLKCLGALYDVPLEFLLNDNASEPVRVAIEEHAERNGNYAKNKQRIIIMLAFTASIVAIVILGILLFRNKGDASISMEDLEGSDIVTVEEFEMDW